MKSLCGWIGWVVGMFLGFALVNSIPFLGFICIIGGIPLGRYIGGLIEEEQDNQRRAEEEYVRKRRQEEYENKRKAERRAEAQALARKYPEATKYYFKRHWGITKTFISDYDITDEIADVLLGHKYSYEIDEQKHNVSYRLKIEAEKAAKIKAEQDAAERKRREEERERLRIEAEIRNLPNTLPQCVSSWSSHSNSSLKHKYFYNYYTYGLYKDNASSSMWETWKIIWHFKNDPDKNVSPIEHKSALNRVANLVGDTLRSTFGYKTKYLTLVCLTASTQRKTELRYKEFSEIVCKDLGMKNAFPHIRVVEDGNAKHDGGSGIHSVSYDRYFFNGQYVVLFDDVRTTGRSLEQEKMRLESFGAKVICAITLGQTKH